MENAESCAAGQSHDADGAGPSVTLALGSQSRVVPEPVGHGHPSPSRMDPV